MTTVFGIGEKQRRERPNWWGLPLLGLFAQMRRKWEEVPFILAFPFLPMSLSHGFHFPLPYLIFLLSCITTAPSPLP